MLTRDGLYVAEVRCPYLALICERRCHFTATGYVGPGFRVLQDAPCSRYNARVLQIR